MGRTGPAEPLRIPIQIYGSSFRALVEAREESLSPPPPARAVAVGIPDARHWSGGRPAVHVPRSTVRGVHVLRPLAPGDRTRFRTKKEESQAAFSFRARTSRAHEPGPTCAAYARRRPAHLLCPQPRQLPPPEAGRVNILSARKSARPLKAARPRKGARPRKAARPRKHAEAFLRLAPSFTSKVGCLVARVRT